MAFENYDMISYCRAIVFKTFDGFCLKLRNFLSCNYLDLYVYSVSFV